MASYTITLTSLDFPQVVVHLLQDVALHQCRSALTVYRCHAPGGSPPSLLCHPAAFCSIVLCIFSLSSHAILCNAWSLCCPSFSLYVQPISVFVLECYCGGRNSSVGSAWARCPRCRGFDPPLGTFSGRGDFSLGVNMGSNSIPPKTPSDESINRGLVCAHMHFIAQTQKILTFICPRRVNAGNKSTPSTHHPRRRNVTTLMVGLKNGHIRKNLTQKSGEPQRYSWGTGKKKKKKKECYCY